MLALHTLKSAKGSTHRKKRLGRGNASGHGTYSTRGLKGQRARSGGRGGLVQKGVRSYLLRIPKTRGFKSRRPQPDVVTLATLDRLFTAGSVVSLKTLRSHNVIGPAAHTIKIIGSSAVTKVLTLKVHAITAGAREAIEKAGGQVELMKVKTKPKADPETATKE